MDVDHAAAVTIGPRTTSVDLGILTVCGEGITGTIATLTGKDNGVVVMGTGIAIKPGPGATASQLAVGRVARILAAL
jgi:hypothetical protein